MTWNHLVRQVLFIVRAGVAKTPNIQVKFAVRDSMESPGISKVQIFSEWNEPVNTTFIGWPQ